MQSERATYSTGGNRHVSTDVVLAFAVTQTTNRDVNARDMTHGSIPLQQSFCSRNSMGWTVGRAPTSPPSISTQQETNSVI
jgi:hypothetical protein